MPPEAANLAQVHVHHTHILSATNDALVITLG